MVCNDTVGWDGSEDQAVACRTIWDVPTVPTVYSEIGMEQKWESPFSPIQGGPVDPWNIHRIDKDV